MAKTNVERVANAITAARIEGLAVTSWQVWEEAERNETQRGRVGYVAIDNGRATLDVYPKDGKLGPYAATVRNGVGETFLLNQRTPSTAARAIREALDGTAARRDAEKRRVKIEEKGHDCDKHVVHGFDPKSVLGDYYTCGLCGDLLQVG